MKRFKFVNNTFKRNPIIISWDEGSLWWNRKYQSGPWYLRKTYYKNGREEWLMGVGDGSKGDGGRVLFNLSQNIKEEVLKEFEPFKNHIPNS